MGLSSSTRNKLWVFGDSFSHGGGCHFDENMWAPHNGYHEQYKNYALEYNDNDYLSGGWATYASNYLNFDLRNMAQGGSSFSDIEDRILLEIKNAIKGDIIIIGIPFSVRQLQFSPLNGKKTDFYRQIKLEEKLKDLTQEQANIYVEYHYHFFNKIASEGYSKYYKERCSRWKNWFSNYGIKTIFWDLSDYVGLNYQKFETITQHTKGKIMDSHWSFKGNVDFFNQIIKPQLD